VQNRTEQGIHYVYILRRPNGEPFYVGMGCNGRISYHEWRARIGDKGHRYSIIRKILASGTKIIREKIATGLTHDEAKTLEVETIAKIGRKCDGGPLCNQTLGGDGSHGYKHDLIAQMKMRQPRSWKWSEEHRAMMIKKLTGRVKSEEERKKLSAAVSGEKHWNYGKRITKEHAEKLFESRRKRVLAEGVEHGSVAEAGKCCGVSASTIFYRIKIGRPGYSYL